MGRFYVASIEDFDVTAANTDQDMFEIQAPSTGIVVIHSWRLFQTSDVGDAAEEILEIETVRGDGTVTTGSGGITVTPQPLDNGDAAPSSTVKGENTTRMAVGTGTLDVLEKFGFNVRVPLEVIYTPELRPIITPSDRWTLSIADTVVDTITVSASVLFEEIGG